MALAVQEHARLGLEYEQQRAVVAISNKFFVPFFAACPYIKDVVGAVQQVLCANLPEYNDKKLEP